MNTITLHRGDVRDVMATLEDGSIHGIITSPPFLALRSYLPSDHVDKHREIGSEPTPAAFIDTMLGLTGEWRRLLAPWATLCVEIGDTYAGGNGQATGDSNTGAERRTQVGGGTHIDYHKPNQYGSATITRVRTDQSTSGPGWPLAKSLTGIPTLYTWSLAYNRNLLTGTDSPAGAWRIRNLLTWTRPNPPVGALGDKCRPATSFVTVACTSEKRWFDLDAVRSPAQQPDPAGDRSDRRTRTALALEGRGDPGHHGANPAGAPPLDWWDETDAPHWQPLHNMATAPYKGAHYATYPLALPSRLLICTVPQSVCSACGEPRRRIVDSVRGADPNRPEPYSIALQQQGMRTGWGTRTTGSETTYTTLGWTDCDCHCAGCQGLGIVERMRMFGSEQCPHHFRPGVVLDPFAGSGTTGIAAALHGRDAVLIDLDKRNVELTRRRISEHLRIVDETTGGDIVTWTVEAPLPDQKEQTDGQMSIFDVPESRPVIELVADL